MITPFNNTHCRVFAPEPLINTLDIEKLLRKMVQLLPKEIG
jgi:hypothetical protein